MICSRYELIAVLAIGALAPSTAIALDDARLNRQLMRLDMETRLEQTCDTEVMQQINREHREFSVDKVIAYTFKSR